MNSQPRSVFYLGNDLQFIEKTQKECLQENISFQFFLNLNGLREKISLEKDPIESAILLIEYDLPPIGGLPCALYLAENKLQHLGSILLTVVDKNYEINSISDYFIESCNCNLSTVKKNSWSIKRLKAQYTKKTHLGLV